MDISPFIPPTDRKSLWCALCVYNHRQAHCASSHKCIDLLNLYLCGVICAVVKLLKCLCTCDFLHISWLRLFTQFHGTRCQSINAFDPIKMCHVNVSLSLFFGLLYKTIEMAKSCRRFHWWIIVRFLQTEDFPVFSMI